MSNDDLMKRSGLDLNSIDSRLIVCHGNIQVSFETLGF